MENEQVFVIKNGILKRCTGPGGDVVIPEGVTKINTGAFEGCIGLTSATIPASVTDMSWPFQGCTNLTHIHVDAGNPVLRMAGGMLLQQYPNQGREQPFAFLLGALPGLTGEVIVPEEVAYIDYEAFHDCAGPFHVTLPAARRKFVTGLLDLAAFRECRGLTGITIPEGITYIGPGQFEGCTGLTSITIPEGVTEISHGTFSYCTGLTRVDLPASVTEIDCAAFLGCTSLTEINVDSKNQVYGSCDGMLLRFDGGKPVLYYCPTGRTGAVSIPEGVTEIGRGAFRGCTRLDDFRLYRKEG